MTLMIYGANGYTGELIAREARARGLDVILAGRTAAKLAPLATELGVHSRAFALTSPADCQIGLDGVSVLLNCAGPFSRTAAPLIAACLATQTHYLDITGEIPILESAHGHHTAARAANIVICPGAGFDVVPTDCLAAQLKSAVPDATELWLGFDAGQQMSPGTAKTMIEYAAEGGKIRRNGQIVGIPTGSGLQAIDFGRGLVSAMPIPWGDVASAYYTTQIPNITVFTPAPAPLRLAMKTLAFLCRSAAIKSFITARIGGSVTGPTAAQRDASPAYLYGRAMAPDGSSHEIRFKTLNGYSLTVLSALAMAEHLLSPTNQAGAFTPSALMGQDFIYSLPGTIRV
jgi:short subunit dehydrogenase-like uncharacterized protein